MVKLSIPFVDLSAQNLIAGSEIECKMREVIESSAFILGEEVALFEDEFARFCDAKYGVGVGSGTEALNLALLACGVGQGDEVITAANTFIATAAAIAFVGAKPVLVDIDPVTYNMDVNAVQEAINQNTKAIIPIHLYGQAADMEPLLELARERGILVIEDACQAHGARYKGRPVGALGDIGCFSFYPSKNLGAYGDGGMVVTNHNEIAETVRMLRNHGQDEKYHHQYFGFTSRLDTLQASVLRVKLKYLNEWNEARRDIAHKYNEMLTGADVVVPQEMAWADHIYHLYVIRSAQRDHVRTQLNAAGIATGVHYPIPIHLQPAAKHLGYRQGDFPVTEKFAGEILSLPMYPGLTETSVGEITSEIIRALRASK